MFNCCERMIPLVIQPVYELMQIRSSNKFMDSNANWEYIIWTSMTAAFLVIESSHAILKV